MAPVFKIIEHVIPGQHIREYPNATKHRQEDVLKIVVKQYVPLDTGDCVPHNAVTVVGMHGNGFPKVSGVVEFCCVVNLRLDCEERWYNGVVVLLNYLAGLLALGL